MYKLSKNKKDLKFSCIKQNNTMKITPKGKKKNNISNIEISDINFSNNYAKHQINNKMNKLIDKILDCLEGNDDNSGGIVLDEISRLKGIIYNKYKEYMITTDYKESLTKLILLEEQFKRDYSKKVLMSNIRRANAEFEVKSGRSR